MSSPVTAINKDNNAGCTINDQAPSNFICPLTLEVMNDPLASKYGHNYERDAIIDWLERGNGACPMTRKPLLPSMLIPNVSLRVKIRTWKISRGVEVSAYIGENQVDGEDFEYGRVCAIQEISKVNAAIDDETETETEAESRSDDGSAVEDDHDVSDFVQSLSEFLGVFQQSESLHEMSNDQAKDYASQVIGNACSSMSEDEIVAVMVHLAQKTCTHADEKQKKKQSKSLSRFGRGIFGKLCRKVKSTSA